MANHLLRSLRRVAAVSVSEKWRAVTSGGQGVSAWLVWPCVSLTDFRGPNAPGKNAKRRVSTGRAWQLRRERLGGCPESQTWPFSTTSHPQLASSHLAEFEQLLKTGVFQKSKWDVCAHQTMESLLKINLQEAVDIVECCSKAKYLNEELLVGMIHQLLTLEQQDLDSLVEPPMLGRLITSLGSLAVQSFESTIDGMRESSSHPNHQAFRSKCGALIRRIVEHAPAIDGFGSDPHSDISALVSIVHGFGLLASVGAFEVTGEARELVGVALGELSKHGNLDRLPPIQLSNIFWACGVMKYKHFAVFRKIFELLRRALGESGEGADANGQGIQALHSAKSDADWLAEFSGGVLPQVIWAMGSMQFKDPALLAQLNCGVLEKVAGFTSKELWMSLDGLSKLEQGTSDAALTLAKAASRSNALIGFLNDELISILRIFIRWAYAEGTVLDSFWAEISHPKRMASLHNGQLVEVMEVLIQVGYRKASVWKRLGDEIVGGECARNLSNPQFASMLVCFGKASYRHEVLMGEVSKMLLAANWLSSFDDQAFVNIVYGLALMGFRDAKVVLTLAKQAVDPHRIVRYEGQHLSGLVYAFARLDHQNKELLDALMWEISKESRLGGFTEQQLSNVLWGCGKLKYFNESSVGAVIAEASSKARLEAYTEQGLSNLVYCLGRLNYRELDVLGRLGKEVGRSHRMKKFSPQALSNITFAFGKLDFKPKKLLKSLEFGLTQRDRLSSFNELELSNLMFGLGKLSFKHRRSIEIVQREVCSEARLKRSTCPDLCNIAYGLSGMGLCVEPAVDAFLDEVLKPERLKAFSDKELQMVLTKLDEVPCVQSEPLEILAKECTARFDAAQDWDYPIFRPVGDRLMFHPPYPQRDATEQEVGELLFKFVKLKQAEEEERQEGRPIWGKLLV